MKRMKIKTLTDFSIQDVVRRTNKNVILKIDQRLSGQTLLMAQTRKPAMAEVLSSSLRSKSLYLANVDGSTKKTDKSSLGRHTKNEAAYIDSITGSRATVIDATGIVQQINGENMTFKEGILGIPETRFTKW